MSHPTRTHVTAWSHLSPSPAFSSRAAASTPISFCFRHATTSPSHIVNILTCYKQILLVRSDFPPQEPTLQKPTYLTVVQAVSKGSRSFLLYGLSILFLRRSLSTFQPRRSLLCLLLGLREKSYLEQPIYHQLCESVSENSRSRIGACVPRYRAMRCLIDAE